jgi:hypothetical protein
MEIDVQNKKNQFFFVLKFFKVFYLRLNYNGDVKLGAEFSDESSWYGAHSCQSWRRPQYDAQR